MKQDRRQYPRLIPDSALLVSLGESKRGFLFDLSEGGLAFNGLPPQNSDQLVPLVVQLSDKGDLIEALGEVVWTNTSSRRCGLKFVGFTDASRERLRQWISMRVFSIGENRAEPLETSRLRGLTGAAERFISQKMDDREDARPAFLPVRSAPQVTDQNAVNAGYEKPLLNGYHQARSIGLVFGVMAFCAVCVALGYYFPRVARRSTAKAPALSPRPLATPSSEPAAPSHTPASTQAPNDQKVLLQVAALASKGNAAALLDRLRKQSFPAFVQQPGRDGFYRVDVGPYADEASVHRVEEQLKSGGFGMALERRQPH